MAGDKVFHHILPPLPSVPADRDPDAPLDILKAEAFFDQYLMDLDVRADNIHPEEEIFIDNVSLIAQIPDSKRLRCLPECHQGYDFTFVEINCKRMFTRDRRFDVLTALILCNYDIGCRSHRIGHLQRLLRCT